MPIVKTPNQLGYTLRATRTALKLPAADVAAMAGTTAVTLRRLEDGSATSALRTLFALLDELGIEMHLEVPPQVGTLELPAPTSKPRRTRARP
ncbi:MAG: helix-turn-helix transcriptional regulator [Betaproteobacteria bacterium]